MPPWKIQSPPTTKIPENLTTWPNWDYNSAFDTMSKLSTMGKYIQKFLPLFDRVFFIRDQNILENDPPWSVIVWYPACNYPGKLEEQRPRGVNL